MKNKILLIPVCLFSAFFLVFIFKLSDDIQRKEEILTKSGNVIDVTNQIQTKALVTNADLSPDQWASTTISENNWKEVKIPDFAPVKERDFKEGNFGYYRIIIPKESISTLDRFPGEVEFSPQYVLFSHADVFVNGKFVKSNTSVTGSGALLTVPIETGRDNLVAIKGKIKTGDTGIKHRGKIFIGKTSELRDIHTSSYKGTIVFPLIFLLCKGSVIFVFVLIYLLLNVQKFFEKSLVYSLCVFLEDFLTSDFLTELLNINMRVYLYNTVNIVANVFLFLFLADVVSKNVKKKSLYISAGILALVSYAAAVDILHTSHVFNFNSYLQFWNVISIAVIAFYIPDLVKKDKVLFGVVVASIALSGLSLFYANIGLNFKMLGSLLLFFMVAYESFAMFRREQVQLQKQEIQLLEQEKDVAIGKTASLLAHDVRRPLEQMKLILDKVSKGEISEEFLRAAKNDVSFSITSVNNQINDIMNYSKSRQAELTEISFYHVLSGSIKQIMTINNGMDLALKYDLKADVKVQGDESRLSSALTNLISNAVEAIRDIGKKQIGVIRFSTSIENGKFIFKIHNDGPVIPEAMIKDIWKPLFTHGKESGTGLGLASVMKTINDHRGEIKVRNSGTTGVEFEISLLKADTREDIRQYEFLANSSAYNYEVKKVVQSEKRPLRIFLLDDDNQVEDYFKFLIQNLPFQVEFTFATHFETAKVAVQSKRFDLYILDYDLGEEKNGLDFYEECLPFLGQEVVIHSGREKTVVDGKKCGHQKKPMTFEELQTLCENAYANRLKILLVDDSELTCMAWEMFHGRQNIQLADSPENALKMLSVDEDIDLCVVDYYFDNSQMNGEQLAKRIKEVRSDMRIVLASNTEVSSSAFKSIDKNHFDVRDL